MDFHAEIDRLITEVRKSAFDEATVISRRKFVGKDIAMKMLDCGKNKLQELKSLEEIRWTNTLPVMYEIDSINEYLERNLRGKGVAPKRRKGSKSPIKTDKPLN